MLEDGTLYGVLGVELLDDYVGDSRRTTSLGLVRTAHICLRCLIRGQTAPR